MSKPTFAERLDALLPERDAAVFASNAGMEQGAYWVQSFVEALAIAYGLQDQVAALREKVEMAGRLLLSVRGDGGYPRLKCYWCHEGFGGAMHATDCPYDAWLGTTG